MYPNDRPKTSFGGVHAHDVQKGPYAAPCGACSPARRKTLPLADGTAGTVSHRGGTTRVKTRWGIEFLVTRRLPHVPGTVPTRFAVRDPHSQVVRARTPRHPCLERPCRPTMLPPPFRPRSVYTGSSGLGSENTLDCCCPAFSRSPGVPPADALIRREN